MIISMPDASRPRSPMTRLGMVCGLLLLPYAVLPALAEGIRLEYSSTPGEKSRYMMMMEGSTTVYVGDRTQKSAIKTEMYLTQVVTGLKEEVVDILTKIDSGEINVDGRTSPVPYIGQELKTGMRRNGEIVYTESPLPLDMKSMQLVFPVEDLEIGTQWDSTMPPSPQVPVTLDVAYKLVGLEKIKGRECVKIASTVRSQKDSQIPGLSLDVKADGNIYFAYKEGKMIKNDVQSRMTMILKRVVNDKEERIITKMNMNMGMEYVD